LDAAVESRLEAVAVSGQY
jgi:hypothetical protein